MSLIINFNARLGRDAEIKQTQNGSQYVAFTCATDVFTNGNTETVWFNVTDFSERSLKIVQLDVILLVKPQHKLLNHK